MRIIIDAMSGDYAPDEIIKGAFEAMQEYALDITLVGKVQTVKECIQRLELNENAVEIINAEDVVTMEDDPTDVMRTKKESSMAVALNLLAQGKGEALVSAGNTGALLIGSTLYVKRIKGIRRSALCPTIPNKEGGALLLDSGANAECTAEYLLQFAYMGSYFAEIQLGKKNPRVGLCNIGTEPTKGTDLQRETYALLNREKEAGRLNFVGNVEGRDVALGGADVYVCDGFTGNMILKTYEGVGLFFIDEMKQIFKNGIFGMAAALMVRNRLKSLKKKVDYKEVGGAPLLGISKPVIKAHGASNARAMKSAIYQAYLYANSKMINRLTDSIQYMKDNI